MLVPPRTTPDEFDGLETPDGLVEFMAIWLLHHDEMEMKLQQGSQEIASALFEAGVSEVVEADRRSVVKKKRLGLI